MAKRTTLFTPEWYFFPVNYSIDMPATMYLKVIATLQDLTTISTTLHEFTPINNSVIALNMSPQAILPLLPNSTKAYSFQVVTTLDETVTESRQIHLQDDNEEDLTLVYRSSFGYWDTITLASNQVRQLKNNPSTLQTRNTITKNQNDAYRRITAYIHSQDVRTLDYLQELLLSPEIYLLEQGYHQVICETNDLDYIDTRKHTEQLTLDFRFTEQLTAY
jgi:hypothetical protein